MHIRCPHCRNPIEVVDDDQLQDLTCPACGSSFNLLPDETITRVAAEHKTLGHFELLEQVGIGAFGEVWSAHDCELDRTVAIKLPRKGQLTAEEVEAFLREARSAARLHHPNIVAVHEVGKQGDQLFIVSDYVHGLTLADWLTGKRPTPHDAAELCAKIADAVQHAHEHGVVHRDLKPSNIMLDDDGQPHIMDFGLAKRDAGEITMTVEGKVLGTPAYMSPEQAQGAAHEADARSDVYSLGVILFELLTGELPFRGNARMLIHQVINDEPPGPRKFNNQVPADVDTICVKCLQKQPDKRYQQVADFAADLRRFLAGKPIAAQPVSRIERGWRWCKRNPGLTAMTTIVATALVVGTAISWWYALIARAESEHRRQLLYDSQMRAALQAWDENNVGHVRELLDQQMNRDGIQDLRGFEWYYLWKLCHKSQPVRRIQVPYQANDLAFAPDGGMLAVGLASGVVFIVDTATWENVATVGSSKLDQAPWAPVAVAFSRTSHRMAYSSGKAIRLVDYLFVGGEFTFEAERVLTGHEENVLDVSFLPDGQHLVSSSQDGVIKLWDLESFKAVRSYAAKASALDSIAVCSTTNRFACFNEDGAITICNGADGAIVSTLARPDSFRPQATQTMVLSFSPDGKLLASGCAEALQVWDVTNGQLQFERRSDFADQIRCMAFSPDANVLAVGSRDNSIRLFRVADGGVISTPKGHSGPVLAVAFTADGENLITASSDFSVLVWNAEELIRLPPDTWQPSGPFQVINDVGFLGNSKLLVCVTQKGERIESWDSITGQRISSADCPSIAAYLAVSSKGQLALGHENGSITFWDVNLRMVGEPIRAHSDGITALAFSPDGVVLASAGKDRVIHRWNVHTGERLSPLGQHRGTVRALAFSADGKRLASGGNDAELVVWDLASGEPTRVPTRHRAAILSLAFSPLDGTLASASWDYSINLWDPSLSREPTTLKGHSLWVSTVLFSRDGKTLYSASGDQTIKLWDVANLSLKGTLRTAPGGPGRLAISSDEKVIAGACRYGTIQVWRAATEDECEQSDG